MKHRSVQQAGLRGSRVVGKYAAFSKAAPVECVVIAVRYIDDKRNISKAFTEYDVKDLRTGQIYPNVRRLNSANGMDDGDEDVLRPAQKLIGATSPVFDPAVSQLSQSDGDRVMVSFSYGAQHTAVITDVLPHPKSTYGTKREQGQRRFTTHKGTSVETRQDGTHVITRGETSITLKADESIEIVHKSGSQMRFLDNGDIEVIAKRDLIVDGVSVKAGASAIQPVIRGNDLNTNVWAPINVAASNLLAAMGDVTAALGVPPGPAIAPGPSVAALVLALSAFSLTLQSAIAAFPSTLSTKTVTE
jgi:hypothetical protein